MQILGVVLNMSPLEVQWTYGLVHERGLLGQLEQV